MDKKLKAKWIAALRSGRFKQHRNQLTGDAPGAYCCLGVLSRLLNPRTRKSLLDYPPYEVLSKQDQFRLAGLNDDHGYDFKQIATYVKQHC